MPRTIWISLVPVVAAVVALATLAAIPWTANSRLARVRLDTSETLIPARHFLSGFIAAVAIDAAEANRAARGSAPTRSRRYDAAIAVERASDSALAILAPRMGRNLERGVSRLHSLTALWHVERASNSDAADESLAGVMATAAQLDSAFGQRQAQEGARIRSLESLDVLLPTVLVPILVVVLLAIYWTGRRMAALADQAEAGRLALALAAEQKVTLVRGLTHDLKNGLGAASGFATLLREEIAGPLTARQREHVTRIGRIIEQTITSVEHALTVARTEAVSLPVRRKEEDLRALVVESAADYIAAAERAGLTLRAEYAEDLPRINTDPSLVANIIGDLLSNAIKYTPSGGQIWLRASCRSRNHGQETGSWVVAEVRDTGPGIPATLREHVFDEFFRAPGVPSTARGQGIGLAMSRRVARLLGGELTLDSEEGRGATFTLWLPAPPAASVSSRSAA
jgi:signal transduction histidine kinase